MSRPTAYPNWATNVNYAGGPNVGTPTKVAPSGGRMADGWRNNDVPPAQEQNYEMDLVNQWIQWFDDPSVADLTALAAYSTNVVTGKTRVNAGGEGQYIYFTTPAFGIDGLWEVDAPGAGNEHWQHSLMQLVANSWTGKGLAAVGPVPSDAYPTATASGRINKSLVPHGWASEVPIPLQLFTTNSTVPLTNANGAVLATWDMGTLTAVDYVHAHINGVCASGSANGFEVGVYISNDNGATWNLMTPYNGVTPGVPFVLDQTGTGAAIPVSLSFVLNVSAGHNLVQLRAASIGVGVTKVSVGAGLIEVRRT